MTFTLDTRSETESKLDIDRVCGVCMPVGYAVADRDAP